MPLSPAPEPSVSGKPVTITDVARHAGVSISTVSRVLNGVGKVDGRLAEQVDAAAAALAYQPNRAARMLQVTARRLSGY